MGYVFKLFGWLGVWILIAAIGFFAWAWMKEYSPSEVEDIAIIGSAERLTSDTIKIVSWNIGYAGLGDDMDFFYDGGLSSQTSYGRTRANLDSIISFLSKHTDADFILLQEVDFDSKRSYNINQYDTLIKHFGMQYKGFSALNYSASYVPIPFSNPIGGVKSGLVTLTKIRPSAAVRYQYPSSFGWPMRMFNLKRGMLSVEIPIGDTSSIFIANTHNSAYDDGDMRAKELMFIDGFLNNKKYGVVVGDWNANPPSYTPSKGETSDAHFQPSQIAPHNISFDGHWAWDKREKAYTARYGYEPYNIATTTHTVIDFALSTISVEPISVECVDLKFKNSDHNPVVYRFAIRR